MTPRKTKAQHPGCPVPERNEKHDAYFCAPCDVWLEIKCDDPGCYYCPGRPHKPSQVQP